MVGDSLLQRLLFLHPGLASAAGEQIAWAQERDGTKYRTRLTIALIQHQNLLFGFALCVGNHGGIQAGKQFTRLVQRGHGVMVAAQHHQLAAGALQFHHKPVV
ncbi:hypothetical protein D3C78_1473520 [compost metagenome]